MATTDRTVKGFNIGGDTYKYDFEALANRPEDFGNKNVVMIQDERPVESGNRVWVKETAAEIEIPTSSEFEELKENIVVVSSDTPTSDDNRIWIEPEDGGQILVPTMEDIGELQNAAEVTNTKVDFLVNNNLWSYGTFEENKALHAQSGATVSNNDYDTTDYIPVSPGEIIYGRGARFWGYDLNKSRVSGATGVLNNLSQEIGYSNHYYIIPDGVSYFRICMHKAKDIHFIAKVNPYEYWLNSKIDSISPSSKPEDGRKLYTLGDSITKGMFATVGASSASGLTSQGYPYWIGIINGYSVVNLGNSGSGWANVGSAETADDSSTAMNAKDVVDGNDFSDADIITMAWGLNDWKGASQNIVLGDMSSVSGDGTVIGNMKYCIETLMTKKPTAQLIVLLPLNTNRQWSGMDTMTLENNWAFGYAYRNNQTLQDYRTAIKQCAEYYNVKVIDLEEVCPINRLNLRDVCGDGLHPTKAFHKRMGFALAPLIH